MNNAVYRMPGSLGVSRVFARINRGRPAVLAFHGVTSEAPGHLCNYQGKHLYLPIFSRLMEHVRERYSPVPLARVLDWLEGRGDVPEGAVAVTFDDGYRNVLANAVPVLSRLGIPATVYVVTDFVREGRMVWTDRIVSALAVTKRTNVTVSPNGGAVELSLRNDLEKAAADAKIRAMCKGLPDSKRTELVERIIGDLGVDERGLLSAWRDHEPLRPEDLKTLLESGIEVGSHTVSHKILSRCEPGELRRELEESKKYIQDITGKRCVEFSYPNGGPGDFNAKTSASAREAGYRCALTSIPMRVSRGGDPFEIPRYTLARNDITLAEFAVKLSGCPDFVRSLKRKIKGRR